MKNQNQKNPGSNSTPDANTGKNASTPDVNPGKKTSTEKTPDVNKSSEPKTKSEEAWKNPDPTTPERKNDPDPTKPEQPEVPHGSAKQKNPSGPKNPAATELNSDNDEEIGSLEDQDIDDQGITGEANDDNDFEGDASIKKSA